MYDFIHTFMNIYF